MYTPKALAFVLHLTDRKNISTVKSQLVAFIQQLQSDDKVYVQNSSGLVFEKRGQAISVLASYRFDPKYLLHMKLRDAIAALNAECFDDDKFVFIIADTFVGSSEYEMNKLADVCEKTNCKLTKLAPDNDLQKILLENYKGTDGNF